MEAITIYWPDTGEIVHSEWRGSSLDMLAPYVADGMAWVSGASDPADQHMPGGVRTDRPALAPDDVSAPYLLDLGAVTGTTRIVDELGTTLDAPGGETVELPAGTYTVTPPFPWREQTVVVA